MKYDLAWGNSVCVREAFIKSYHGQPIVFDEFDLSKFNYPNHHGDPELIDMTKKVIKRQINQEYKHVFIVNGATGGCVIAMRAYQMQGREHCITRKAPYYVRYPSMIQSAGLYHTNQDAHRFSMDSVALVDIPSNPLGILDALIKVEVPIILDGVYLNNVYMNPSLVKTIPHDIYVGSFSKLLGINGIRLGWIATNDDLMAERIKELITSEYCGLSTASQEILKSVLNDFDWELFETYARFKLDLNREEWSKLEKFFGQEPVKDIGMFYYGLTDKKCQEILTKADILYTKGSAMGTDDGFGRFNLGQDNDTIRKAVASILKADRV